MLTHLEGEGDSEETAQEHSVNQGEVPVAWRECVVQVEKGMEWILDGVAGRVTRISWEFICGEKQRGEKEYFMIGLKIPGSIKNVRKELTESLSGLLSSGWSGGRCGKGRGFTSYFIKKNMIYVLLHILH